MIVVRGRALSLAGAKAYPPSTNLAARRPVTLPLRRIHVDLRAARAGRRVRRGGRVARPGGGGGGRRHSAASARSRAAAPSAGDWARDAARHDQRRRLAVRVPRDVGGVLEKLVGRGIGGARGRGGRSERVREVRGRARGRYGDGAPRRGAAAGRRARMRARGGRAGVGAGSRGAASPRGPPPPPRLSQPPAPGPRGGTHAVRRLGL